MKQILFEFANVCDELEIDFFLMYGTALGIYRDKNLMPKDNDVDVGVICSKTKLVELFNKLVEKKYEAFQLWQNPGWELNRHFWKQNKLLDVHFQFLKDEEKLFKEFDVVEYEGRKFNIPHPIEDYLDLTYTDWKTPSDEKRLEQQPNFKKRLEKLGGPTHTSQFPIEKFLKCKGRMES